MAFSIPDMRSQFRSLALVALVSSGLGLLFFAYLHYSETGFFPAISENYKGLLFSMLLACTAGYAAHFLNQFLDSLLPWKSMFAGRFLIGYITEVLCAALILIGLGLLLVNTDGSGFFWSAASR